MTTDAVGGVWRYTVDLATALARQGINVLVASLGPRPSAEQKRQMSRIPGIDLRESDFALEWMPQAWRDVDASGGWLLDLQNEFRADLIHLNGYAHAALPWRKPVLVMAHSCVYSWWRAVHGCAPGPEWEEYKRRVSLGLNACNTIAAPSHYMASAICREYEISPSKLEVIHNFSRARVSALGTKQALVLAAGRVWDTAKNFQLLEGIASRLAWELRIAGTLPYAELQRAMALASVFVHPALYEPFGLSVLEAARNRCALVLSDISSLRELWEGAALFIDPRDQERWAFELNRLTRDATARDDFGRRAHRRATRYRSTNAMHKYLALYATLMQTSHKEGAAAA
jgi:glycosyltransferase involved in cell wall biosynthesis